MHLNELFSLRTEKCPYGKRKEAKEKGLSELDSLCDKKIAFFL